MKDNISDIYNRDSAEHRGGMTGIKADRLKKVEDYIPHLKGWGLGLSF